MCNLCSTVFPNFSICHAKNLPSRICTWRKYIRIHIYLRVSLPGSQLPREKEVNSLHTRFNNKWQKIHHVIDRGRGMDGYKFSAVQKMNLFAISSPTIGIYMHTFMKWNRLGEGFDSTDLTNVILPACCLLLTQSSSFSAYLHISFLYLQACF